MATNFIAIQHKTYLLLPHALLQTPCIITYKAHPISYALVKNRLKTERFVSWPNILANKAIFPEYLQKNASPDNLSQHALAWLSNKTTLESCKENLKQFVFLKDLALLYVIEKIIIK